MILQNVWNVDFDFSTKKPIIVEPVAENISTDGGLLIFRQWDEQHGFTADFAGLIDDPRTDPEHSVLEMVRSRVFGIIAGYEDQNDHDALRSDAVFKLVADRLPDDPDLASQPTLSRFENFVQARSLLRIRDWFVERFVSWFDTAPREITLDIDVFDDPTHGQQQLTLFHGYYKQYQYFVRPITCAENDLVVLPSLLYGTADVALGLERDLRFIVAALRKRFPEVLIRIRADSGYAKPWLYRLCEQLDVEYTIGLGMNKVLQRESLELLEKAVQQYEQTGEPQRHFTGFFYRASSWETQRWVVVKCEVNAQGTNRRAVVSNRPGAQTLPEGVYDEYSERGEGENRNKELKCELCADRLSDHRYMANCLRMFLHCLAYNLLVSLRRAIAMPPHQEVEASTGQDAVVPEAQTGRQRRRQFNQRREADPLGEGHACTWRMRLIKVACRIKVTARRVRIFLSGSWPFLDHFRDVSKLILDGV